MEVETSSGVRCSGPEAGQYHYPSLIQARDGSLHATYSYHLNRKDVATDAQGRPRRKAIKHAHFNEAWVMQGDLKARENESGRKAGPR